MQVVIKAAAIETRPAEAARFEAQPLQRVARLLGGARVLRHKLDSGLDAHDMILRGLPGQALTHLVGGLQIIEPTQSLEKAMGMSLRTYQRRKDEPARKLSPEQSGRVWKFAEVLDKAIRVFGTQSAAESWLERPAIGLGQRRPIDLMSSPAGVEMVETVLMQLEYGVYV